MRFASRTEFGSGVTEYGAALEKARASGTLIDLTVSNPTRCGFGYSSESILNALNDPAVLLYEADPLGMKSARETISTLYRDVYGVNVPPEHVLLTASTSEAYGFLLRLFCELGDAILVPSPSYPLFNLLAQLHDVEVLTYPLVYHDGWQIEPASLAAAVTSRTRAIVVIHPNNPTGHFCSDADRQALVATAQQHGLPLIVDEVFLEYAVECSGYQSFAEKSERCVPSGLAAAAGTTLFDSSGDAKDRQMFPLTFVLGGLSKMLALPQMKLAWMVASGPDHEVEAAMNRLEVIADTFLSVATPPQVALRSWMRQREVIQVHIMERLQENLRTLDAAIAGSAISRLRVEGGWSAVLRVPASELDTDVALHLLQEHDVAVHPGSFYGFAEKGWLVLSLLPETHLFAEGVKRLTRIEFGTPFPHVGS